MRPLVPVLIMLALVVPQLQADSLQKAYFAATQPGSWARYESSWQKPDGMAGTNIYTYIRVTDQDGRVRTEFDTETLIGPGKGMITRQLFVMKPGFDLTRNYLNHMMFLETSAAQTGEGAPSLMPENVIEIIRQSAGDVTNSVTFRGTVTREGRACDHYEYSYTSGGPHVTVQEGEIYLDETVPFGVIFQKGQVSDAEGELISSFEQKLLDTGAGKIGTAALLAMTATAGSSTAEKTPPGAILSLSLQEAYQGGKIRLSVEVEEGSGGRRLNLVALNKTAESFDLIVQEGSLTIAADSPLGTLKLVITAEHRYSLSPGGSSHPFAAGQGGERGATGGKFQLTVYEGQPLIQGSVNVGPLE